MGELTDLIRDFLDAERVGVLATIAADGKPRQSVVYYARDEDRIMVSTVAGRLKARDVERSGWASFCVRGGEPPFPSATVAGPASIETAGIGPGTAAVVQRLTGAEERPEPQTDEALAGVGRVLLVIDIERVGPVSYLDSE